MNNAVVTVMFSMFSRFQRFGWPVLGLALAVFAAGPAAAAPATPGASAWVETEQTALRLIAATETTGAAETLVLGLHFKMKPGWKIYWRSPGDAGFPPTPDWSRSRNLKTAVLRWPAPERFSVLDLETLGYTNEVVLPMTVRRADPARPLDMAGTVNYLTCDKICIPYTANLDLTLPQGPVRPSRFAHLINRFQAAVPGDRGGHGLAIDKAETWTAGGKTMLRVTATASLSFEAPDLFAEGPGVLSFSRPVVRLSGNARTAVLEIKVFGVEDLTDAPAATLVGRSLTLTLVDGGRSAEKRLRPVAGSGPADGGGTATPLAMILVLAIIGGLILNLMPCVLPVLSIKLLSVVGHGGSEGGLVRLSFLASAAGILFAFVLLAAALAGLKAGGMAVGWGIQFQQPWFLIAMTLMVTAFACNLWGFFDLRLPVWVADLGEHASHVHGLGGHFLQGVLATFLATPCSAPFLGTAVGFALARGWIEIFAVFITLGLGLALPYLVVAAFPRMATRLPRPGPWMVTMKRILGFALAATGVWLLSVLTVSVGIVAAVAIGVLTAAAAGLLYLRHRAPEGAGRRAPVMLGAAALTAFLVPGWAGDGGGFGPDPAAGRADVLGSLWTAFDEAAIPRLVGDGKTVFVDVTADWCLTCQVNKSFVLGTGPVLAAFKRDNVVVMQADWTRPDPVISSFLARHQRYGIPFDVVYGPGAPDGVVLPELLSEKVVLQAFDKAAGEAGAAAGWGPSKISSR